MKFRPINLNWQPQRWPSSTLGPVRSMRFATNRSFRASGNRRATGNTGNKFFARRRSRHSSSRSREWSGRWSRSTDRKRGPGSSGRQNRRRSYTSRPRESGDCPPRLSRRSPRSWPAIEDGLTTGSITVMDTHRQQVPGIGQRRGRRRFAQPGTGRRTGRKDRRQTGLDQGHSGAGQGACSAHRRAGTRHRGRDCPQFEQNRRRNAHIWRRATR